MPDIESFTLEPSLNRPKKICELEQGSSLVEGLMKRQDEILLELDQLNSSIESMINELTLQRIRDAGGQDVGKTAEPCGESTKKMAG